MPVEALLLPLRMPLFCSFEIIALVGCGIRVIPLCGGETWEIGWLSKVNIAENEMTPVFLRYLIDRFAADDKSQNKLNQDPNYRLR